MRSLRILSSDDNESIRSLLFELLRDQGHEVEFAKNSDEVFKNLGRARYDLLILDINTPGLNGYQVAEKITNNITNRPKILIFTARDIDKEKLQFNYCGADAILRKGAPCSKILETVEEIFRKSGAIEVSATAEAGTYEAAGTTMANTPHSIARETFEDKMVTDVTRCLSRVTQLEDTVNLKNLRYEEFIRDLLKEKQRTEKNYLEFKRIESEVFKLKNWNYAIAAAALLSVIRSFF